MKSKYGFETTQNRSDLMSKIRSTDTTPEILLRKLGCKFSIYSKSIPGNPDIIFKQEMVAVFVDGEFWHGYNWKVKRKRIKSNREYWISKIERNIKRDKDVNKELKKTWMDRTKILGASNKKRSQCIYPKDKVTSMILIKLVFCFFRYVKMKGDTQNPVYKILFPEGNEQGV